MRLSFKLAPVLQPRVSSPVFILVVFICFFLRKQPADLTCCLSRLPGRRTCGALTMAAATQKPWQRSPRQALAVPLLHLQTGPAAATETVWDRKCSLTTTGLVWTKKLSFLVFAEARCHRRCSRGEDAVPLALRGCTWARISPPEGRQAAAPGRELSLPGEPSCKQDISSEEMVGEKTP